MKMIDCVCTSCGKQCEVLTANDALTIGEAAPELCSNCSGTLLMLPPAPKGVVR